MLGRSEDPPDIPGIPGKLATFAHKFRRATQIFPPLGMGVGAGIGLGCGFGWPLRRAYGPPRALCGPAVGVGIGVGYGQGFGRRFGKDTRSESLTGRVKELEEWLDNSIAKVLAPIKQRLRRKTELEEKQPTSFILFPSFMKMNAKKEEERENMMGYKIKLNDDRDVLTERMVIDKSSMTDLMTMVLSSVKDRRSNK